MIFFLAKKLLKLLSKISQKKGYEFVGELSEEDTVRNIDYLAHALRKTRKSGAGVGWFPIGLALKECGRVVRRKEARGIALFPFEKWIKENLRLLLGTLGRIRTDDFSTLPHTDGVPRIVILADFIVKYSAGKVSAERVEKVLHAFQTVTPLTFTELEKVCDAIAYRLLVEVSLFAERSIHYYTEYLRAEKEKFDEKRESDSYFVFYAERHGGAQVGARSRDRDLQSARLGFENLLADNELLTAAYIGSLRELPKWTDAEHIVSLSEIHALFSREEEYRQMSAIAQKDYLGKCRDLSARMSVGEGVIAQSALLLAERHNLHFGEILYHYPEALRRYVKYGRIDPLTDEKSKVQGGYAAAALLLSLLIAVFPAYYLRNLWAYLSVLPLFIASLHPVEYLLKRFVSARIKPKPIPQMDYETLPESMRTVVVTSRFIAGEKDAEDALLQAETMAASERDLAVTFVVLADFPSSDKEWGEEDEARLAYLCALPRSPRISFLIRKRIKKGDRYVAYERKRGAILELFAAMKEADFERFYLVGEAPRASYAILLDDDTELLPGTIRSAIQAMAHPLNRDYDLMTFGGKINRFSIRTHYASRFLRACGVDVYPHYSDFYADAFDCALYCGKAMVRISAYLEKLKDFFPDGRILSHDIIEGAVLRSGSLKRCVYEDAPATFLSDEARSSRWARGDVQLIPYAFCNRVKDRTGRRVKNPIAPIYKLIIFINGVSVLREFMSAFVILAAYFSGNLFLLYYALSCHLFVKVYALIASFRTLFTNVRAAHAFRTILYSLELLAEEILLLPFRALKGVFLFSVTSFKMATRSASLLEWKPFRTTQGVGSVAEGAKFFLPTLVFLSLLCLLSGDLFITLYAAFFCLYAFYLLFSGRRISAKPLSKEDQATLLEYSKRIYRYFTDLSGEGLIPDNLQLFPYEIKARMTSPTNIGFSLLAEVCAVKLGLTEKREGIKNAERILGKIEGLEKWRGHLFNWYDVKSGEVMPPRTVSTVDSANLIACLIVTERFLREEGESALADRARRIIEETDFTALYDRGEKLLAIVYSTEEKKLIGRYDLLASESRLAYYFAIAQGVDPACYFRLGRDAVSLGGNTLLSWSGTAFEYMLPRLFLRAPRGSLLFEQECRSAAAQRKDSSDGLFGRSECGYAEFNDDTAYRYKAVGCPALALSEERADVIAPYATFLYLPVFPRRCLSNLAALRSREMEGEYGCYEALDLERDRRVTSYMTHHQGMSLAALTNVLCGEEIVRLFSSSPTVRSIRLLLTEENIYTRQPRRYIYGCNAEVESREVLSEPRRIPDALLIRSGEYRAMYDALGRSYAGIGEVYLTKYRDYLPEKGGVFVQVKEGDHLFSPAYYPCGCEESYALFRDQSVKYVLPEKGISMEVYPLDGYDGELRVLEIRNESEVEKEYTVSVYADMMVNGRDAYESHPAYSDLFLTAEYDETAQVQYLSRKNAECEISFAASFSVKGLSEEAANANSYNVIGRCGGIDADYEKGIKEGREPAFGDVLYPCFAATGKLKVLPHRSEKVYFCLLGAKNIDTLRERNRKIDLAYRSGAIELIGRAGEKRKSEDPTFALRVCGELLFRQDEFKTLSVRYARREELARYGVRGEEDILYLDLTEQKDPALLDRAISLSKRLTVNEIPHVLAVRFDERKGAGLDSGEMLKRRLEKEQVKGILIGKSEEDLFRSSSKINLSTIRREEDKPFADLSELPSESALPIPFFFTGEGGFLADSYLVCPFGEKTLLPYSNVVGAEKGGFVATENGGGFTFGENAREDKLTVWSGDSLRDPPSEMIFLETKGKRYRLNGNHAAHQVGETQYSHLIDGIPVRLSLTLAKSGKAKVYEVIIGDDFPAESALTFTLIPALGWRYSARVFAQKQGKGYRLINAENGKSASLYLLEGECRLLTSKEKSEGLSFRAEVPVKKGAIRFVLDSSGVEDLTDETLVRSRAATFSEIFCNRIQVESGVFALDLLYNSILPYQTRSARLNAKTGYYQCGGATGFRDQLQDCLAFLISDPERVRRQILESAAHQYEEGDAQHWWHPPHIGVRTRISDDRLWLVYLTERYLEVTGDFAVLDEMIPFLSSAPLCDEEISRYEIPAIGESAPLREHLLRAIRVSCERGEHGLLKIGSGDWNDGLDRVGVKGRGESVWLTMFAYRVIMDAIPCFAEGVRRELVDISASLAEALSPLQKDGRYPLAFTDDGEWLGYRDTVKCTIALNPQTWSLLSGAVPLSEARRALEGAKELVDEQARIVKLSSPPFDKRANYGYISAYPKGVRENGGQYTHAAVWYLKALLEIGEKEEAYRILTMLNPILRCESREGTERYKGEPYVLAGDIYGCDPYRGRVGWTWYTGSAGWLKYTLTEDFFGIKKRGEKLYVKPNFPSSFNHVKVVLRLPQKTVLIEYKRNNVEELLVNGVRVEYLPLDDGEKNLEILCHFR